MNWPLSPEFVIFAFSMCYAAVVVPYLYFSGKRLDREMKQNKSNHPAE